VPRDPSHAGRRIARASLVAGLTLCAACVTPERAPHDAGAPAPAERAKTEQAAAEEAWRYAADVAYVEVITGGAAAEDPLPMVVAIHGLGDDPRAFAALFDGFPHRARVILPRGIETFEEGGWAWFPIRARDLAPVDLARSLEGAARRVDAAVVELQRTRPTLGKPIVTGFSQGGMMSFALAILHPEHYAAARPIGGWLPPLLWPEQPTAISYPPIVAWHGGEDTIVPLEPTREAVETLRAAGLAVELRVEDGVGHTITPTMQRDLWVELGADTSRQAAASTP
jgi:phospholipase/carboxylesterase